MKQPRIFPILISTITFVFFIHQNALAKGRPGEARLVQSDVRKMLKSLESERIEGTLRLLWPGAVKHMGGLAKTKQFMRQDRVEFKKVGLKIGKIWFTQKPRFYRAGKRRFAIIPVHALMHFRKLQKTVRSDTYYIGVKDARTRWKYVDGAKVKSYDLGSIFGQTPDNMSLPSARFTPVEK